MMGGLDLHIEVDTGSLYWEKIKIVIAAPSSMEEPREGEWYVILLPITVVIVSMREKKWKKIAKNSKLTLHDVITICNEAETDGKRHYCDLPSGH